ncbi:MAG: hypothetical protein IPJ32_16250 [Sphingobacteriaceae bacterium]|nr:hypothetical protein [Sphingobacteriaceae bacterium]
MKKRLVTFLILLSATVFSQAPQYLNYQGVARDAGGNIISTSIGLKFEILQGSATGITVYDETNTSLPSSAGIFTAAIGSGVASTGTFSAISWANGPYFIRVSMDPAGGTSFSTVGTSQLMSVPYALYAETSGSGSAMPTGTLTGQTMYWDNPSNTWIVYNNLLNDGKQVVIGDQAIVGVNKLKVASYSSLDSAAIFAYHPNAIGNQAAIRGLASGSAPNSGTLTFNPIVGGHFVGYNTNNNGSAVGTIGQASSPGGDAIGVIAIGTSSSNITGKSVGLYASGTGPTYINNFAAIFDRGKVFVNDTLVINTNGSIGDVLTRGINGKSHWAPGGSGPWGRTLIGAEQNVYLQNNSDFVNIGLPSGIGASEKLHVHNVTGDAYISLSTSLGSNNVGLVFGESSNISKAFLAFDNTTNSLTYRQFGKRVFYMDGGNQKFYFGKIPNGAGSLSAMSIYDSIFSATPRPILRLINTAGSSANNPAGLFLGDDASNGMSLAYDKNGAVDHLHIGNPLLNTFYHTFTSSGEFYIGNNGTTAGLVNISGGAATSSDLNFNASSTGRIVFNNGHIKAIGASPTFSVVSTGTLLSSFPFTISTIGSSNDTKGYMRAACTFSFTFGDYVSFNDEIKITVTFNQPYASIPTVVVSPANDILGLTYHTTILPGNTGFNLYIRNYGASNIPVNSAYQFDFNYIVIE